MKYIELKTKLKNRILFTQNDLKMIDNSFHFQRLKEWQDKGYIKKVIKGYYIFSDIDLNEQILFFISNRIYQPSYVSFEMALSYYGLIPESVYLITSASSRKTQRFETQIGNFEYHRIKPKLMFGYNLVKIKEQVFKIAEAEKAILDYLYINPHKKTEDDFEELRIDKGTFKEEVNINKFERYLKGFNSKALTTRAMKFKKVMKND